MAHRSGKKTARISKDPEAKSLGVKLADGMSAKAGCILVRQRGTRYRPGINVRRAADDTLFAVAGGIVKFRSKRQTSFTGRSRTKKLVDVLPKNRPAK